MSGSPSCEELGLLLMPTQEGQKVNAFMVLGSYVCTKRAWSVLMKSKEGAHTNCVALS